jgi:hypothetical protein
MGFTRLSLLDEVIPMRRRTILHLLLAVLLAQLFPLVATAAFAENRGTQLTRDTRLVLVNQDVGAERWAISLNEDGTATGNVFRSDGGSPAFVFCSPRPGSANAFSCWGADACTVDGAERGIQTTPDGKRILVNKDVGAERWAIARNEDGTATGNVFRSDGGPPAFISCEPLSSGELACYGADDCLTDRCVDQYTFIANVRLPGDFFQPPTPCGAGYTFIADVALPLEFFVMVRPHLELKPLGTLSLQAWQATSVDVAIDPGVASLMIIADGGTAPIDLLGLTFPSGPVTLDPFGVYPLDPARPYRSGTPGAVRVVSIPNTPVLPIESGNYNLIVGSRQPAALQGTALLNRRSNAYSGRLDLRVFLVALEGITAATAPDNPAAQAIMNALTQKLGAAGIQLGAVSFYDYPADRASALTVVDLERDTNGNGQPDQLEELFSLPRPTAQRTLDLFLVRDIVPGAVIGMAGSIPGPALVPPTIGSGVVAALFQDAILNIPQDVAALAHTIVHETGHYLGLYHTTEMAIGYGDPLTDTPFCDGLTMTLSRQSCPDASNLMFPQLVPSLNQSGLTSQQAFIIQRHPLVYD